MASHITVLKIATRARLVVNDVAGTRWSDAEILDWVNAAEAAIVAMEPPAYVVTETFALVEGTKQALPSLGVSLVDIVRNMGTDGTTPGDVVDSIDRKMLDSLKPGWHGDTGVATVDLFIHDPRDPTKFYVYPPQPSSSFGYVEVEYSKMPPDLTTGDLTDPLNLREVYQEAILNYLLFRMYSKEAKEGNGALAKDYFQAFIGAIGARSQGDATIDSSEG